MLGGHFSAPIDTGSRPVHVVLLLCDVEKTDEHKLRHHNFLLRLLLLPPSLLSCVRLMVMLLCKAINWRLIIGPQHSASSKLT